MHFFFPKEHVLYIMASESSTNCHHHHHQQGCYTTRPPSLIKSPQLCNIRGGILYLCHPHCWSHPGKKWDWTMILKRNLRQLWLSPFLLQWHICLPQPPSGQPPCHWPLTHNNPPCTQNSNPNSSWVALTWSLVGSATMTTDNIKQKSVSTNLL